MARLPLVSGQDAVAVSDTPMFAITVVRQFSAGHAIRLGDGSLEPWHGHNWCVQVTVAAMQLDGIETVMDFHELERIVDAILAPAQNANLNEIAPFAGQNADQPAINPTAERVAWWIGTETAKRLPGHVTLKEVRIEEAAGCWAVYEP